MIVTQIMDLGILLSNDLSFNNHITIMCNKALRVFGFIRRNCLEFKDPNCFKLLYCSLVRSILEYGSVVWNPYQMGLINKIERVQKRFLRVLAYKANRTDVSLVQIASEFNIVSLKNRRTFHDVSWLFKLLNSRIICPELLSQIPLNVPQTNSRVSQPFYLPTYRNNYSQFAPINRMLTSSNSINNFDFFMII
jgi:hypothetical protein